MKTLIFAHRGASKYAPENTMPAFILAHQMGADGIETDVQLTKDGVPVLIHDEKVNRTTNGTGFVQNYTYQQLQMLDAGARFSENYANTRIIMLEELVKWIKNKEMALNIELKNNVIDYEGLEKLVYDLLKTYDMVDRTVISSFNPKSIARFKQIDSGISTALLTSKRIRNMVSFAKELGATALHINYRLLNKRLLEKCQADGLSVRVYTINRSAQMMNCYQLGATAIFTDLPDEAKKYREIFEQKVN